MSSVQNVSPSLDGQLTVLPGFIDFHAEKNPDVAFATWNSSDSSTSTKALSFAEFSKATHRIAHMIRPGRRGQDGEVVAIVIHTDTVLYCAIIAGCVRAGFVVRPTCNSSESLVKLKTSIKPYPMSPRNSAPAMCNMMEKTSVHRIIAEPSLSSLLSDVRTELSGKNHTTEIIDMPGWLDVFPTLEAGDSDNFEHYPPPCRQVSLDDVAVVLHSSGSTGFPKAIKLRHEFLLNVLRSRK